MLSPAAFSRRVFFRAGQVPNVTPIGANEQFVNGAWNLADQVQLAGGVDKATMQQRTGVVAVDRKRNLYLVRIDKLSPMTKSSFNSFANLPMFQNMFTTAMFSDRQMPSSPLALPALGKRLGYLDSEGKSLKSPDEDDSSDSSDSPDSEAN